MRWKATVIVRLFQYMSFIWSVNNNNFLSLKCPKWFAWFISGDLGLEDEERPGQPKRFENEELEALLDEDCCRTQEELAESLGVTQVAI